MDSHGNGVLGSKGMSTNQNGSSRSGSNSSSSLAVDLVLSSIVISTNQNSSSRSGSNSSSNSSSSGS